MTYNYYRKCSICPKNVGHYCDECEVRIDCVFHEASKLNMDYEHLKAINDELLKQINNDLEYSSIMLSSIIPDEGKIKVGYLRAKIRSMRDVIVKNREIIPILEQEVSECSKIDEEIKWVREQIVKLRSLNEIHNLVQTNVDIPININIDE